MTVQDDEDRTNIAAEPHAKADNDDNSDSMQAPSLQQQPDDAVESSSLGSEGGKGAGSGGGYSADCSSSDASTDEAAKLRVPETEMKRLSVSSERKEEKSKGTDSSKVKRNHLSNRYGNRADSSIASLERSRTSKTREEGRDVGLGLTTVLPQWNGVRIHHPMDPRIDISTVGHIQTSSLSAFPNTLMHTALADDNEERDFTSNHVTPSIDQYMRLMEVVRPFFHAHGFSHFQTPEEENGGMEQHSSECAVSAVHPDHPPAFKRHLEEQTQQQGQSSLPNMDPRLHESRESDSSSMVVLARVKRKHLRHKPPEDHVHGGSNNSSFGGSNASSTTSSDKRVRIQHPELRSLDEESKNDDASQAAEDVRNEHDGEGNQDMPLDMRDGDRQESTSASSSESQNNLEAVANPHLGFGVPAVVSEYSSSRAGSSGASNHNQMSTSGSGSAGNTGSGTASGSNQGGSSGSGNDQGGISSNGHGSSASGNDVKGSSEETMDNSGENNSGEGNSDATNSKHRRHGTAIANGTTEPTHGASHRHYANMNETSQRDVESPTPSSISSTQINSMAVRERLQDKKRKRMNMRREYEEKVQQEMESSEASLERDENSLLKPGRPVTLDKVLSFTKLPRIVVNANPPFLVVHTNAAFCRLSGIDSHLVVGKPISSLLTIPDPQTVAELQEDHKQRDEVKLDEANEYDSTTGPVLRPESTSHQGNDESVHAESRETQGLSAAEAAGRARAAASQEDSVERLIATSGFGRYIIISLNARPLLGQKFSIAKPPEIAQSQRGREEGSNGSSITSNCEASYRLVPCSMGVSPVVSSPEAFAVVTDKDQDNHHYKPKRRKHHAPDVSNSSLQHLQQPRRNFLYREISLHRKRHLITHYVIQLEPLEGASRKLGSHESQSSTSTTIEAEVLGMTKSEVRHQRGRDTEAITRGAANDAVHESEDNAMDSESSNPHEAVTAVG